MASTPMQADPPFDDGAAAPAAEDRFAELEDELARLVHAKYTPRVSHAFGAAMLDAANLRPPIPREPRSPGRRGIRARVAIAVCLGAAAIWAWRSYGGPARDIMATWVAPFGWTSAQPSADEAPPTPDPALAQAAAPIAAAPLAAAPPAAAPPAVETSAPPPARAASQVAPQTAVVAPPATTAANAPDTAAAERQKLLTLDLAALRRTVAQLAAGQEQLSRQVTKLQAEKPDKPPAEKAPAAKADKHTLPRVAAPPAPPLAAPARKQARRLPVPPPAARQVATASPLASQPRPAAQIPAEPQPANAPLRPPMPVAQP